MTVRVYIYPLLVYSGNGLIPASWKKEKQKIRKRKVEGYNIVPPPDIYAISHGLHIVYFWG